MSDKLPDDKDGLLEYIKKSWLPVAGFIGAVTLIYNFYKLWLGDQTTVTFIIAGIGLLILLTTLGWVGFKTKTTEIDTILQKDSQTATKRKIIQPAYSPKYRKTAWAALSIVFLGTVFAIYSLSQQRQAVRTQQQIQATQHVQAAQIANRAEQARATQDANATKQAIQTQQVQATQFAQATQQAHQEKEEKLVVVIAAFEGPEEVYGLRNEILESLNSTFSQDQKIEIITVEDVITPDLGSLYARTLGKQLTADLVIWGWYRPTENPNINIHIENLSATQLEILQESEIYEPQATLAQLESFEIQRQIGSETRTLIAILIATLKYESEDYQEAKQQFEQILSENDVSTLVSRSDLFYYLGITNGKLEHFDSAIQAYTKAIETNPLDDVVYNNRGGAYYELGEYQHAIEDLDKAIQINPQLADAYNNRGNVYYKLAKYQLAIQDYDKAIQNNPQLISAYANRGNAHSQLGDYQLAIQDYDKTLLAFPQLAEAYVNRGITFDALGEYDRAFQDYDKAIQINPQLVDAYNNRGIAYADLGQYQLAIQDFDKAIQLNPSDAYGYYNRALTYYQLEQYERAIQDYDKSIQLDPNYASAYENRGNAYYELEQYDRAIQDYDKVIQLNPNNGDGYYSRARTYFELKEFERAIKDYSKALQLNPSDEYAYYGRGLAYQTLGKAAEAEADFKKYEELTGKKP